MVRAMGPELVWRLQHIWPKDAPDLAEVNLSDLDDNEARRIVEQVEDVKHTFEQFVAEDIVPHISRHPARVGLVGDYTPIHLGILDEHRLLADAEWHSCGQWRSDCSNRGTLHNYGDLPTGPRPS